MLLKGKILSYSVHRGYGFIKNLGLSGEEQSDTNIFFHASSLTHPSIVHQPKCNKAKITFWTHNNFKAGTYGKYYQPTSVKIGSEVCFVPDRDNPQRAYTVVNPKDYIHVLRCFWGQYIPDVNLIETTLYSWIYPELLKGVTCEIDEIACVTTINCILNQPDAFNNKEALLILQHILKAICLYKKDKRAAKAMIQNFKVTLMEAAKQSTQATTH